jgi:predicted nucleotidyltransferase
MEKLLNQLVEKLRKAYGERLVSVVLYGSGATGDYHAKFSDFNVLAVLAEVTPDELAASEEVFRWWREQSSPAPLLMSEHELAASTDCFAIEFHDIKREHRILFGKDVIAGLVLGDSYYRAQVEHELRAKLLRLRQKTPGVYSQPALLGRLLLDSVSTFCVLFRHALRLGGVDAPLHKREIIALAKEHFGIDVSAFDALLDVREGKMKPRDLKAAQLLAPYMAAIAAVIHAVDRLEK